MDGDDISFPQRFDRQVAFLQENSDVDLLGTGAVVFKDGGNPLGKRVGPINHSDICAHADSGFMVVHPSWMGRIDWFRQYQYRAEALRSQDLELLRRSYKYSKFANLSELLLGYRDELSWSKVLLSRKVRLDLILREYSRGGGFLRAVRMSASDIAKISIEIVALATGLESLVQKYRVRPLLPAEKSSWYEILV